MKKIFLLCLFSASAGLSFAQNTGKAYNPHELFAEEFNPPAANLFRSAKGVPGASYWQNSSSYTLRATLSEKDTSISGDVTIRYTNNSPDKLDYLWLQLDQNIFAPGSRSAAATPFPGDDFGVLGNKQGGYTIGAVTVVHKGKKYEVKPLITDTRMQLRLNSAMEPGGDEVSITINYRFIIPANGAGRFGRLYTADGVVYQVSQWFPRMCVYDDVEGWNSLPYLGQGEFYCDYGDYDYYITAPAGMIIYGSGDLQNPTEVLTATQIQRLAAAEKSDKTVTIIGADEAGKASTRPATRGDLTWHFRMTNTRDIAFAAGKGMIWDAARINLPSGRKALAMSCYPKEVLGDSAWSRSTEYLKHSIEIYSENFYEYPWNVAVSSGGAIGGMEYPGVIFNDYREKRARLWFLVSHEIGHNWFPMIVGSNERKYMWHDEGLNTYINFIANDLFNKGEYLTDSSYFEKEFFASRDYEQFMQYRDPLMVVSDAMDIGEHYQYYGKTAYGLNLLRTVVVGKERFDYAFRKYTEAWAFKHPTPYDFFRCINNATGENLNWFWKEWFFTTWKLDQTISAVSYIDNDPRKGSLITVTNNGKMIMPLIVKLVEATGKTETVNLPIEIWQRGGSWTFSHTSSSPLTTVILDPEQVLPDMNRANNVWKAPAN